MGTSLTTDVRRREERALIKQHLDVLNHYGADLSSTIAFGTTLISPAGMIMALIASMIVGETERGMPCCSDGKRQHRLCLDHERL